MALDDRARVQRLREAPRTDLTLGERMHRFCEALQTRLVGALARLDGTARRSREAWAHPGGGGGVTHGIEDGAVFARAAVEVSAVREEPPAWAALQPCFSTGLTLAVYPVNPYVPAVLAHLRYRRLGADPFAPAEQAFGGEAVLVPVYPFREDAEAFHRVWKAVCDRHPSVADYRRFKARADEAFALPRRREALGVGGLFFDGLRDDPEGAFHFVREAGRALLAAYVPLVERRRATPYGAREAAFQTLRRARLAEFCAAGDREAGLGLEIRQPIERLLRTLPPSAAEPPGEPPEPGTPEAEALRCFRPHDWLGLEA
jgi:coproporphyrinogen III oxidase